MKPIPIGIQIYAKVGTGPARWVILRARRKPPVVGETIRFQDYWDAKQMGRHASAHNWTAGQITDVRYRCDGAPWLFFIDLL